MRRRPAENPLGSALEPESERHFASLSPSERVRGSSVDAGEAKQLTFAGRCIYYAGFASGR